MDLVNKATSCCSSWDLSCYWIQHETFIFYKNSQTWSQLSPEFRKHWRLIAYPTEIEPGGWGRGGYQGQREYFETVIKEPLPGQNIQANTITPPSVIGTKDGYLVIRTDPMVPGLGSFMETALCSEGFVVVVNIYLTVPGLIWNTWESLVAVYEL